MWHLGQMKVSYIIYEGVPEGGTPPGVVVGVEDIQSQEIMLTINKLNHLPF